MTKVKQVQKNIKLSGKLAKYLAKNPNAIKNIVSNSSFVPFSVKDNSLNTLNKKIVKELLKEGKKVIEANETGNKNNPWTFNYL